MQKNIEILQHDISWFVDNERITEMDSASIEHIENLIKNGFSSGEVHICYGKNDEKMASGWWNIINWKNLALALYHVVGSERNPATVKAREDFDKAWKF